LSVTVTGAPAATVDADVVSVEKERLGPIRIDRAKVLLVSDVSVTALSASVFAIR
jgi:hypothetical protein